LLTLPVSGVPPALRPTAAYAAAVLHALAREEARGRRTPRRVTEPGLATWRQFRGRLEAVDLLCLALEDAAVVQPVPYDAALVLDGQPGLERLPEDLVRGWFDALPSLSLDAPGLDYVTAQARLLGIPSRLGRADLHRVKPHQKVLELPGTGGQLAYHIVSTQGDVFLQDNFLVACGSREELTLAGLVAVELGAPRGDYLALDPRLDVPRAEDRRKGFDFVVGLAPDKGGAWTPERLGEIFPSTVVLV